jgi:hypothetical protein
MKTLKEIMELPNYFHSRSAVTGMIGAIVMLRIDRKVRLINELVYDALKYKANNYEKPILVKK